jgi:uncharacterized paraquat-inducible protein A
MKHDIRIIQQVIQRIFIPDVTPDNFSMKLVKAIKVIVDQKLHVADLRFQGLAQAFPQESACTGDGYSHKWDLCEWCKYTTNHFFAFN